MKMGPIEKVILFGGGPLIVSFAEAARARGMDAAVFAVKRHLDEIVDEENRLSLALALEKAEIPFFLAGDINTAPELLQLMNEKTLGIGMGEAYTFNRETVARFGGKLVDFMVIDLPHYRGGAHFTWQILREDRVGAWHIQLINEEMIPGVYDSGAVIKSWEYKLPSGACIPADYFKAAHEEGIALFQTFLDEIQNGKSFALRALNEADSSHFPRLSTFHQGYIDWSWTGDEVARFVSAFDDPYPGAATFIDDQKVILKKCCVVPDAFQSHPYLSGLIYRIDGRKVYVATKSGAILVETVLDETGQDQVHALKLGQRFYTPRELLEAAMRYCAVYDTEGLVHHD